MPCFPSAISLESGLADLSQAIRVIMPLVKDFSHLATSVSWGVSEEKKISLFSFINISFSIFWRILVSFLVQKFKPVRWGVPGWLNLKITHLVRSLLG
jgi:hypothetical protein